MWSRMGMWCIFTLVISFLYNKANIKIYLRSNTACGAPVRGRDDLCVNYYIGFIFSQIAKFLWRLSGSVWRR